MGGILMRKIRNDITLIADKKNKWAGWTNWGNKTHYDADGTLKGTGNIKPIPEFSLRNNIWKYSVSFNDKTGHPAVFPEKNRCLPKKMPPVQIRFLDKSHISSLAAAIGKILKYPVSAAPAFDEGLIAVRAQIRAGNMKDSAFLFILFEMFQNIRNGR